MSSLADAVFSGMARAHRSGPLGRFGSQYLVDALGWFIGVVAAALLLTEFAVDRMNLSAVVVTGLVVAVAQFAVGWVLFLYRGRHPYGSFREVRALGVTVIVVTLVTGIPVFIAGGAWGIPPGTMIIALPLAVMVMLTGRYLKRVLVERNVRYAGEVEKALVYGAGYLGSSVVKRMLTDPESPFVPVGVLDDDPQKLSLWLDGVKVLGTLDDLQRVASSTGARALVVAIARAEAELLRRVSDAAQGTGLTIKVLPSLAEILEGKSRLRDLRDLSIDDVIGRHPVDTNIDAVSGYLAGRRVLVTGAGGSIGLELCRQIQRFGPAELIMLDRDESGLQAAQLAVFETGLLTGREVVLADIRDAEVIAEIFADRRPEVVLHAAALKHLPMLEQYPREAWKSNVIGTLNVLQAARRAGVGTFVNISTDKAVKPISALGHSKRLAEHLTVWYAEQFDGTYLSVRFGNVLGSRGSMVPTFASLIEGGSPLTVTHPDATRYFMTIVEACQLVMQAGGIGADGEVLILDMGEPVRILDVAQRMIEMSGRDVEIVFTGLRPGEKLHESLVGDDEETTKPVHPAISHARVAGFDPADLNVESWLRDVAASGSRET